MNKRVKFNEQGARRIVAATRAYEAGNRNMPPIKFRQVGGDDPSVVFRPAELTGDVVGSSFGADFDGTFTNAKLLDFQVGEDEDIYVVNPFGLILRAGTKITIARGRYEWGIVNFDLTTVHGFDANKNQVLAHGAIDIGSGSGEQSGETIQAGYLFWLDTTECPDGGSS